MGLLEFLKNKIFLKQIIIAIVGVLIFIFFLKWWLGYTTNHKQKIQVPNLEKMSLSEVTEKLKELEQ